MVGIKLRFDLRTSRFFLREEGGEYMIGIDFMGLERAWVLCEEETLARTVGHGLRIM